MSLKPPRWKPMGKRTNNEEDATALRRRAEDRLKGKKQAAPLASSGQDPAKLLAELQIHQVELEMQNDELLRAREQAEESRLKYLDLYDYAPVGYLTIEETGLISEVNVTAATLLETARSRLVNRPFSPFVRSDYQDTYHLHIKKVLRSEEKQTCELVIRRSDGAAFHAQLESISVPVNRHRVIRVAIEDITLRKEAEEGLRKAKEELEEKVEERTARLSEACGQLQAEIESRRLLIAAVEQSAEGVLLLGEEDLRIQYANPAYLRLSGYAFDELKGRDVRMVRSSRHDQSFYESVLETVMRGDTWAGDYPLRRKDGTVITVETTISPVRNAAGGIVSRVVTCHDVTSQRLLEAQLRQSQKMEAIGTLAGGIAHDFNNILAAVIGFTEMVIDDIPPGSQDHHRLQLVLKSGFRGRDLVRQILAFSRKAEYDRGPLALSPLVKETLKLLRASLPSTIRIRTHVGTMTDVVIASPSEVQQVIMNLCTNAAYAMREKGGELTVTLGETEVGCGGTPSVEPAPGKYVELAVKDTGTGIDAALMKRIFEPFFTTKEVGQGTGLGLSVVYGIVKALKGDIIAESSPGEGASFRVLLPAAERDTASADQHGGQLPRGRERILLIDDEEFLAELGKDLLEKLGYTVVAMTDGPEAVGFFSENPDRFDLVLTDMTMPGITGIDVAKDLLSKRPDIPIILCTGYSEEISKENALAMGIRGFLMKPLSRHDLASSVRRILDSKS